MLVKQEQCSQMRAAYCNGCERRTQRSDDMDGNASGNGTASELHVVVGAGPVGSGVARDLASRGERVAIITRSGSGPADITADMVAADASDAEAVTRLTEGATAIYNC